MALSWTKFRSQCKSRWSAWARSLYLQRGFWRAKYRQVKQCLRETRKELSELQSRQKQLEEQNAKWQERVRELEVLAVQPKPVTLPLGMVPPGHQYGLGLIVLCINLARVVGLRATSQVLHVLFEWLGAEVAIPTYQTIRLWMLRVGLDRMQNAEQVSGGAWLADHTNQIGKEKVLSILRVPENKFPSGKQPLRHQDVNALTVTPGESWKSEDVASVYREMAQCYGDPRCIVTDGAVELRKSVELVWKPEERPLIIRDPKHLLANALEKELSRDPHYQVFAKQLGGMRSALQQTELAHFIPTVFKPKARFMNLPPVLRWARTVLWHLDHPESKSRKGITERRFEEKLGWLRPFALNIQRWSVCQQVVSAALVFANKNGVFQGAADQCAELLAPLATEAMSQRLARTFVEYLRQIEPHLRPNERLPLSTEIQESSFALFKQLERQHSKSGFTGLVLAYPVLLSATTPTEVAAAFDRVKVADVNQWIKTNLGQTVTAKRQLVYREARETNTPKSATDVAIAT